MVRRATAALITAVLIGIVAGVRWHLERSGPDISGKVRVLDGDSVVVNGVEIRLYGIDAPEYRQTCRRAGEHWACGVEAARVLRSLLSGHDVNCQTREEDRYGRVVAVCHAAGLDLGAAMVRGGYALAYGAYDKEQREARDARRGVWSSSFESPAAFRARHPHPPRGP